MKHCNQCKEPKELSDFYSSGINSDKLRAICKKCLCKNSRLNIKSNPEKYRPLNALNKRKERKKYPDRQKNLDLKKNYGVTLDQYNQLFNKQNGSCAICKTHQSKLNQSLSVDHDHISKEIRGLLCHCCNLALGHFKDNPDFTDAASVYLRRSKIKLVEII